MNNYRAGGQRRLHDVPRRKDRLAVQEEIRDLMIHYYTERKSSLTVPTQQLAGVFPKLPAPR